MIDLLALDGEDACVNAILSAGGHMQGTVDLIWETVTPYEALLYAHGLIEMDRPVEARELIELVVENAKIPPLVPQGNQIPFAVAQA